MGFIRCTVLIFEGTVSFLFNNKGVFLEKNWYLAFMKKLKAINIKNFRLSEVFLV